MSTYNNRRNYNGNKRRRSGGNSKGSNFWQIVLTLVTIMLVFSVFPVLAAITGSSSDRPSEPSTPLDDGLVHFKLYTTIHGSGCPASTDDCHDDYVEFTCPEGSTWADVFGYDDDLDKEIYCSQSSVYVRYIDGTYGHGYQYAVSNVTPDDLIVPGASYGR